MSELKAHNINDLSLHDIVNCDFYLKAEADKVIAENDAEIAELKAENERLKKEVWEADERAIDAGATSLEKMEEMKATKRSLWLARALRARDIQRWWLSATFAPITERACRVWNNVERKCREKAEEYK